MSSCSSLKTTRDYWLILMITGQAGLEIGARLGVMTIPTLIIERNERIGDSWRKRYKV